MRQEPDWERERHNRARALRAKRGENVPARGAVQTSTGAAARAARNKIAV